MWMNRMVKKERSLVWMVLAFALALRLGFLLTLDDRVFWVDEKEYLALSERIVEGQGYVNDSGEPTAFRPVGYPLFLASLRLFGIKRLFAIRLIQVLLSVATIFLVFRLASRLFSPKAGLAAMMMAAVYPYFVFMPGTVLASTWFSFLLVASTLLMVSAVSNGNIRLMSFAGLLFGLAVLTRPSALLLIGAVILWLGIYNGRSVRKTFRLATPFLVIFGLTVLPWFVRNQQTLGIFNLSTNGGRNLWLGNNPGATVNTGSNIPPPPALELKMIGRSEVEIDQIYNREAVAFIRQNPRRFFWLSMQKALYFWRWDPSPTTDGYVKTRPLHRWASILTFGPIFIFAVVGFLFAGDEAKRVMLLWLLYAAFFTALHAVYFPKVRFRLPLDYFLMVTASYGVLFIYHQVRRKAGLSLRWRWQWRPFVAGDRKGVPVLPSPGN